MAEFTEHPASAEGSAPDIEQECELWDWARAAGASALELRKALLELLGVPGSAYSPR